MDPTSLRLPSAAVSKEAQNALRVLSKVAAKRRTPRTLVVKTDSEESPLSVTVPRDAFDLFLEILGQMANGNAVTIVPVHAELTTQQAADLLNVSRPFLVKLIDDGKLPARLVGTHRRIKAADLQKYREEDQARRNTTIDELAAEAQKHGLGY